MSFKNKLTSRLATLEAARAIFFMVVALGIKESLGKFSSKETNFANMNRWEVFFFSLFDLAYLLTAIRFTHGVSMLHGHEKLRLESSNLPSSLKLSTLALFTFLLAISLYLMALNITDFQYFLIFSAATLLINLLLISYSESITEPLRLKTLLYWRRNTKDGFLPRTSLRWILINIILLAIVIILFAYNWKLKDAPISQGEEFIRNALGITKGLIDIKVFFGLILIVAFISDYWFNRAFYFGSKQDKRKEKFVFVCSPLSAENPPEGKDELAFRRDNVNLAQFYCKELMKKDNKIPLLHKIPFINKFPLINLISRKVNDLLMKKPIFWKNITPFAAHCFFTYFLEDKGKERSIGRQCALAYLAACDAIYVYIPEPRKDYYIPPDKESEKNKDEDINRKKGFSRGMRYELDEARKLGLQIKYKQSMQIRPQTNNNNQEQDEEPSNWQRFREYLREEYKRLKYELEWKVPTQIFIRPNWEFVKPEKNVKEHPFTIIFEDNDLTPDNEPFALNLKYLKRKDQTKEDDTKFEGDVYRKRVYVCTNLRGQGLSSNDVLTERRKKLENDLEKEKDNAKKNKIETNLSKLEEEVRTNEKENAKMALKERMKENVKKALWQCYELATDDDAFLAPFAPQAFFTYFWNFEINVEKNEDNNKWCMRETEEWKVWFRKSLEILKVCDAVYIYTKNGLPDSENLSRGMREVRETAERLGIEIKYKKEKDMIPNWEVPTPKF